MIFILKVDQLNFIFRNLETIYRTPGGHGSDWFILVHVTIEHQFGKAMEVRIEDKTDGDIIRPLR